MFNKVLLISLCSALLILYTACTPVQTAVIPEPTFSSAMTPLPIPTPTESPLPDVTPTSTIADLGPLPESVDELTAWLSAAWMSGVAAVEVQAALQTAVWQEDEAHWVNLDLTGDGRDEWLLTLCTIWEEDGACSRTLGGEKIMGDFWIVGQEGILYRASDQTEMSWRAAPVVLAATDLTGDGLSDAITETTMCGAHTCYQLYHVLSAHHGPVANVVRLPEEQQNEWGDGIEISYSEWQIRDATDDGRDDLLLQGGYVGSAGAGIHRGYSQTWSWDGQAIALTEFEWEESNYRFHLLYDANEAFDAGDDETAQSLYGRVIHDESLEDVEWAEPAEEIRRSSRQFAAFRLALLALGRNDGVEAASWQEWLLAEYPDAPLARAAQLLLTEWEATADLAVACRSVTESLLLEDNPTGPLAYMGYANPTLEAEMVCPLP